MKILLINKYLFPKGGDAISTIRTGNLLAENGHEVSFWGMSHPANEAFPLKEYFIDNVNYESMKSIYNKFRLSMNILYSFEAKIKITRLLEDGYHPDIVHLNNFAHQISPSILDAFKKAGIPMVMTMHDYKMVCPVYTLLREGKVCDRCKNGKYLNCFKFRCSKGSGFKSVINTVEMYLHHDVLDIYDKISAFISPSLFLKTKLEEMGFKKKIFHIFNFMDAFPGHSDHANKGKYILYFGRVSSEKGIMTLLKAIKGTGISLKIAGTGPFEEEANAFIKKETVNEAELIGYQTGMGLQNLIQTAMFTVLPSEWYENNPLSVLESFSYGKPVIGSRIGGIPELVIDNRTGFTFETGNHDDLRQKIVYLHNHLKLSEEMGEKGRQFVEVACNPTSYYNKLMEIYAMAISRK